MGSFVDVSDLYASEYKTVIKFTHVWSGETISFKAFLTDYGDTYKTEWNSEQVYGRNDPIQTFKNTTRVIDISWDVPAADSDEANKNMNKASKLVKFLYPNYEQTNQAQTITKPPLVRVSFMNLIQGADPSGLLCTLDGTNFSPDLEAGWFDSMTDPFIESSAGLFPKVLNFTATLTVLHEETLGWDQQNKWSANENFPFLPPGAYFSGEPYLNNFSNSRSFPPFAGAFNNQQLTDAPASELGENQSQNQSNQVSEKKRRKAERQTRSSIQANQTDEFIQSDSTIVDISQEKAQGSQRSSDGATTVNHNPLDELVDGESLGILTPKNNN
jgi:hypothetical protein